jgi:ABC-2 type transport system ATP-binding protein
LSHSSFLQETPHVGQVKNNTVHDDIVCTWGLTKRYGNFEALTDCSVRVRRGEVFGLLGPNGAGKTTLIRLMLGFLYPSGGRCEIDGFNPLTDGVGLRQRVAYLPGDARLPRHMRGSSVLRLFADMHPGGDLARSRRIAQYLELDLRRRVAFMSTGMRQKLALSVVLGLDTPLLILDEPTANLDPTIRAAVMQLVIEARDAGRTVIFSSHVLGEIEDTCDRVAFLRQGRLAHELTMSELFQRHRITALPTESSIEVPPQLRDRVSVALVEQSKHSQLRIDTAGDLAPLLPWLDSLGLKQVRVEPLGLRAVYDEVHSGSDQSGMEDEV